MGDLAVTQVLAVQPHIEAGVNTLKVQIGLGSIGVLTVVEVGQVGTAGVLIGDIGGIGGERIVDVGVLVTVVAVVLPDAGDGDGVPGRCVEALLVEQILEVVDALAVLELPVAVQKLKAVGVLTVLHQIVHSGGSGDEVAAIGRGTYMMGMQVLKVGGNDHFAFLLLTHYVFSVMCLVVTIF